MSQSAANSQLTLRQALEQEKPLVVVGAINAYCALMARDAGFKALYLSGAGVANASYGIPDLGMITLQQVVEDTARLSACVQLPIIVDADTGFDKPAQTCKALYNAGAAAIQIEDQVSSKRCGHRDGKKLVNTLTMTDRIKAIVDARENDAFAVIARTDSYANEGVANAIERSQAYIDAGADIIFAEALTHLVDYQRFCTELDKPVLANITEFGKTPLYSVRELAEVGVSIVLYPLSAFRAMNAAAMNTYRTIRQKGSQASLLETLQSRDDLYKTLDYMQFEKAQDEEL